MKALVTRPRADAAALAQALAARGIEPVLEPLLAIRQAPDAAALLAGLLPGIQALLFTSANGLRAFAQASSRRDIAVLAVGDATAQAARDAGFVDIESAEGDVADLADLVVARRDPAQGALLHAAASTVAGDLSGRLAQAGFEVRRVQLYDAIPAEALSGATTRALSQGEIGAALFFSPRTAATFVTLARRAGIADLLGASVAVALSPAVAKALAELAWRRIATAAAPNEAALFAALDRALREKGGQG